MTERAADNIEDIYELSPMQEGMLFHTLEGAGDGVYVEQLLCTVRGALDVGRLARAWARVIDRHPILRTAFVWEGLERPLQAVRRHVELPIEQEDWSGLDEAARDERLEALIVRDRRRSFDLEKAPLMRVTLAQTAPDTAYLLWTHHHLLLDGWSVPLVMREVAAEYASGASGADLDVPRPPRPYRDYILWLRGRDRAAAEAAWRAELAGIRSGTPAPLASRHAERGEPLTEEVRLSGAETRALERFAREQRVTLNTLVQGAWAVTLGAYAASSDVVFGATVSGRPAELEGADRMVGLFINSLPVRLRLDPARPVGDWLRALQARQAVLREHEATPLASIRRWLALPADASLFDTLLVFVNYPVDAALEQHDGGLVLEGIRGMERSSVPLTVFAIPHGDTLLIRLMSDGHHYDRPALRAVAHRVRDALLAVTADARRPLGQAPLVAPGEPLPEALQAPVAPIPQAPAHVLFEEHAARHPEATAATCGPETLTYGELNARANQLAHHLLALGAAPDEPVALSVERTLNVVVGALAIMKAGAAYLPIDPAFPPARVAHMLSTTAARIVITDDWLRGAAEAIAARPATNPARAVDPEQVAYVIFTSGSTGVPKGAALAHRALTNLLLHMRRQPGIGPGDRMLAIATISFDLSVLELLLPLSSGAAIVIADRATAADGRALQALLRTAGVTVMQGTPSTWRLLLASGWDGTPPLTMISGGEPLPAGLAEQLLARGTSLWNLYGPTETTIYSTGDRLHDAGRGGVMPLGRAYPNQPAYILDPHLRRVPPGAAGELFIGGDGVARGYVGRPDLTAERFLPDPFSTTPGARMYRSGDLARVGRDGAVESLGRRDFQVKVRGYRVELGEIETALERLPGVAESIVAARVGPDAARLLAYVRTAPGVRFDEAAARAALRTQLPDYMVPALFVSVVEFERLPNGKVDRGRLPDPGAARPELTVSYEPPAGPLEPQIARIWQDVLKLDRIGANDNFFDVGGDSLLAVTLFGKLREAFGRELRLVDLFAYPTVRAMARFLGETAVGVTADTSAEPAASGRDRLRAQRSRRSADAD